MGHQSLIIVGGEQRFDKAADICLILYDQDLELLLLIFCILHFNFFGLQPEADGRSLAQTALGLDLAARAP